MRSESQRRDKEIGIYSAVLRLIAAGRAPDALTVQEIADEAAIGKGTVYEYFPSKEAILRGLTAYCVETELDRLEAATADCCTLDGLLDALMAYLEELAQSRVATYRIIAGSLGVPQQATPCRPDPALGARLQAGLHAILAPLRASGEVDPQLSEGYCLYALSAASVSCIVLLAATEAEGLPRQGVPAYTRLLLRRALCPPTAE